VDGFVFGIGSAIWLGILTSISPCPLATNIAAVSFVGQRIDNPRRVLLAGLLYTAGRTLTYVVLGALLVNSLLSAPGLSRFLQTHMNQWLGPVLILAGMFLLGLLSFASSGSGIGERAQKKAGVMGMGGAVLLGAGFALSFCPVSAALFFGSLIPLGVTHKSGLLLPALYGVGTALPVIVFAVLVATGARFIGTLFDRIAVFEKWARRITGTVFVLVGVYLSLIYIFGVSMPF